MRRRRTPDRFWVYAIAVMVVYLLLVVAASASAGTVTVKWNESPDRDLERCRITIQNATGGAISTLEVPALNSDALRETPMEYDTRALQGTDGKLVSWCVDKAGQTSVTSNALAVKFPDVAPGAPRLVEVLVVP